MPTVDASVRSSGLLHRIGVSISNAIHPLAAFVAAGPRRQPDDKTPSRSTLAAIAEVEAGKVESFNSVEDLMADLNAKD